MANLRTPENDQYPLIPITNLWKNSWQAEELRKDGWTLHIEHIGDFNYDWTLRRGDEVLYAKTPARSRQKALRAAYNRVDDLKLWQGTEQAGGQ